MTTRLNLDMDRERILDLQEEIILCDHTEVIQVVIDIGANTRRAARCKSRRRR